MAKNIELKAKISNVELVERNVSKAANSKKPISLNQTDIFYNFPYGRLKLREINSRDRELIYYLRSNKPDVKESKYIRMGVFFPNLTKLFLKSILGIKGEITKNRKLYFVDNTRIHIDRVKYLGTYIEFEYVVDDLHPINNGYNKVNALLGQLDINKAEICSESYMDLINIKRKH